MEDEEQFQQRKPARDYFLRELENVEEGTVRLWGYIVALNPYSFVLNDGETQVEIEYGNVQSSEIVLQNPYRIICEVIKLENGKRLIALVMHKMLPEEIAKYKSIVELERRIPIPDSNSIKI